MRRIALFGVLVALSGCGSTDLSSVSLSNPAADYVGSPVSGFGGFIADTHTPFRNPNAPTETSPNAKRLAGEKVAMDPLVPDSGNVWPAPFKPSPTLSDLEHSMDGATPRAAKPATP